MFKIGEKVRVRDNCRWLFDMEVPSDFKFVGVVKDNTHYNYGVDFGEGFEGHDLSGLMETNTGWYISEQSLELAKKSNKEAY